MGESVEWDSQPPGSALTVHFHHLYFSVFSRVHGCKPPLCCCTHKGKGKECHAVPGQAVTVPEGVSGFLLVFGLFFFFFFFGGRGVGGYYEYFIKLFLFRSKPYILCAHIICDIMYKRENPKIYIYCSVYVLCICTVYTICVERQL